MGFLLKEEKENLLIEYNLLREEIWDRSYKTWVVFAILVVGSLLVAFAPGVENFPTPVLSIVIIITASVLYATSERVNTIAYGRMEEIAKQLRIAGPTKTYKTKIERQWWYIIRKNIAYVLSAVLTGIYLFLIFDNIYLLAIAVVVGLLAIFIKEAATEGEK